MQFLRPNPVASFAEEVLSLNLPQVASVKLRHYTRVTQAGNQSESRTPISAFGLYTLSLSCTILDSTTQYLVDFIHARRGRAQGFRVRLPSDYQLTAPQYSRYNPQTGEYTVRYGKVLPEQSPTGLIYRIYRVVETRSLSGRVTREEKPIFKPRPGTIRLWNGTTGALLPSAQWLLDATSGQILFIGGVPLFDVGVLGEFDLPVRLAEDEISMQLDTSGGVPFSLSDNAAPPVAGLLAQGVICDPYITRATIDNLDLIEFVPQDSELTFTPQTQFTGVGNILPNFAAAWSDQCNGNILTVTLQDAPPGTVSIHFLINGSPASSTTVGSLPFTLSMPTTPATVTALFEESAGNLINQSTFTSSLDCSTFVPPTPGGFMSARQLNFQHPNTLADSAGFFVSEPPPTATNLRISQVGNGFQTIPIDPYVGGYIFTGAIAGASANFTLQWYNGVAPIPGTFTTTNGYTPTTSGNLSEIIDDIWYPTFLGTPGSTVYFSRTGGAREPILISGAYMGKRVSERQSALANPTGVVVLDLIGTQLAVNELPTTIALTPDFNGGGYSSSPSVSVLWPTITNLGSASYTVDMRLFDTAYSDLGVDILIDGVLSATIPTSEYTNAAYAFTVPSGGWLVLSGVSTTGQLQISAAHRVELGGGGN